MGNKLKEFVTAAGLSIFLSTSALGQDKQNVDLKAIEADSISITTTDGRVVFNRASAPEGTAATNTTPAATTGAATRPSTRPATRTETPAATDGGRGGRTGGRTGTTETPLRTVEDCVTISNEFIARSARTMARNRTSGGTNAPVASTFVATCFDEGKPVAKITFGAGTAPVVELVKEEGPQPPSN